MAYTDPEKIAEEVVRKLQEEQRMRAIGCLILFAIGAVCWYVGPALISGIIYVGDMVEKFHPHKDSTQVAQAPATIAETLRQGSHGPRVQTLQHALQHAGFKVSADSTFGSSTTTAVKGFQRVAHLRADGVVDPVTWEALQTTDARYRERAEQQAVERDQAPPVGLCCVARCTEKDVVFRYGTNHQAVDCPLWSETVCAYQGFTYDGASWDGCHTSGVMWF